MSQEKKGGPSRRSRSNLLLSAALVALLGAAAGQPAAAAPVDLPKTSPRDVMVDVTVTEGTSMAVSVSPDGKQLVTDLQGSLWITPATGGPAHRITDLFNDARQPVWSPDGKTIAYFAYRDGGYDLWSIKPDGTDQKKLTTGPFDDRDPMWSPDGTKIAFASDRGVPGKDSYNIWTLDVATGALTQVTDNPNENRLPTWSPDGKQIAYASTRGAVSAIFAVTLGSMQEHQVRQVKGAVAAPSWGPGGQLAYVVTDESSSRLEIDGKTVSGTETVFPFRVSWLPQKAGNGDGGFYYVSDGKVRHRSATGAAPKTVEFSAKLQVARPVYDKARRDFDSVAPRKVLGLNRPAISPDGKMVAFAALEDIWLAPVAGGAAPQNLTHDTAMQEDPAWSPDGSKLVYSSDKGGGLPQLWVRDMASGQERKLTSLDLQPLEAVWSQDGTRIAFIAADGMWGTAQLGVVDVASGKVTWLSGTLGQPGRPSWSADGRHVAIPMSLPFSKSFREGTNQIAVYPSDHMGEPTWQIPVPNLSIDTRGGGGPSWSPDGQKMAAIYEGQLRVWPVSADGAPLGPPRSLTSEIAHSPSWAGDSRTILFQSNDRLKKVDVETGVITEVPLDMTYTLAKPTGRTIIHAGKMIDSIKDETQKDVDIVIDGNRIVAVRPHGAPYDAGAKVIEAPTLTAIPGLIEFHAHTQKDFGSNVYRAWLAYGITTVRTPGNQPYEAVEEREASEAGAMIAPRLYATGHLMEWQRVYYKMGIAISGPAHLELELKRAKALKYDLLKSYVRLPDLEQRRVVEFAHNDMGVPVTTHEIYPAAFVGVDSTEHLGATSRRGYSPKQGPLAHFYQDVISLFGESRRSITPTNFGSLVYYVAAHPEAKTDPRLAFYPEWAQESVRGKSEFPPGFIGTEIRKNNADGIRRLYKSGARLVAGTDTPIAINLHAEIASYVDAGLTPFQALQAATVTPAEVLGLDAGVIAAGKLADITLVEGDPRQDISATAHVREVVSNGRVFEVKDLLAGK